MNFFLIDDLKYGGKVHSRQKVLLTISISDVCELFALLSIRINLPNPKVIMLLIKIGKSVGHCIGNTKRKRYKSDSNINSNININDVENETVLQNITILHSLLSSKFLVRYGLNEATANC
jgi:hypothetical protein